MQLQLTLNKWASNGCWFFLFRKSIDLAVRLKPPLTSITQSEFSMSVDLFKPYMPTLNRQNKSINTPTPVHLIVALRNEMERQREYQICFVFALNHAKGS